jgi:CxxC-x17-CxxC domain-containing protein
MASDAPEPPDQTLTCRDCGRPFVWSAGEQAFFAARGFTTPKRCPECRGRRRLRTGEAYAATCAGCGARTAVPFPPRPDRPAYCRPCLAARQGLA